MFFEGDLQAGVSQALSQRRLVACFLSDGAAESLEWESLLLHDSDVVSGLEDKAVLLHIQHGSQEAGFLSAFCPVGSAPSLIVIKDGALSENIISETTQQDVKSRLLDVLGPPTRQPDEQEGTAATSNNTTQTTQRQTEGDEGSRDQSALEPATEPIKSTSTPSRKGKEKESQDTVNQGPGPKSPPITDKSGLPGASRAQQDTWVQQQRKRNHEAMEERQRILRQIENDRQERKQKEQERKAAAAAELTGDTDQPPTNHSTDIVPPKSRSSRECALKIRTFDGSTIASRFPSDQSLREHVRAWIETEIGKAGAPYEFKHVLAPMPNRRIGVSEEEESLQSLGLTPSATLVMVPVSSYTEAYSAENQGYISQGLSYGYGFVKGGFSLIGSLAGSVLPSQSSSAQDSGHSGDNASEAPRSSIRVRTLGDQAPPKDDQQLYNGNQLNFEPRREDDDNKED